MINTLTKHLSSNICIIYNRCNSSWNTFEWVFHGNFRLVVPNYEFHWIFSPSLYEVILIFLNFLFMKNSYSFRLLWIGGVYHWTPCTLNFLVMHSLWSKQNKTKQNNIRKTWNFTLSIKSILFPFSVKDFETSFD